MGYEANEKEIARVIAMTGGERYSFFLGKVSDWEEVWSVADHEGKWRQMDDSAGNKLCPVWPAAAYVTICCTDEWKDLKPKCIPISSFKAKWIPGLMKDSVGLAVFPTPQCRGVVVDPIKLDDDLQVVSNGYE